MTARPSERRTGELDLEYDFGHVMPWLWTDEVVDEEIDRPDIRAEIERILRDKFGEAHMWQIASALNRLIERGNADGRFRFRLLPEAAYLPERRWFRMSPYNERSADAIRTARTSTLEAIVSEVEQQTLSAKQWEPLLFLALTLDEGWTGESLLHDLLGRSEPVRIGRRPFLRLAADQTVREECYPVGYCTARVLGAIERRESADASAGKPDLRSIYSRARTWMRRVGIKGPEGAHPLPEGVREYLSALRHDAATSGVPALAYARNGRHTTAALPEATLVRLIHGQALAGPATHVRSDEAQPLRPAPARRGHSGAPVAGRADRPLDRRVRHLLYTWRYREHEAGGRANVAAAIATAMEQEEALSVEYLLASWGLAMVRGDLGRRRYPAPGTVYTQYTAVSGLLGPYLERDLADLSDGQAWLAFYADIATEVGRARGPAAWRCLERFHRYIARHHGGATVDFDVLQLEEVNRRTRNDLVMPAEHRRALTLLDAQTPRARAVDCARIMLILGFRLGLRFDEARQLEIGQIEEAAAPWVHVAPNYWQRRLKGDSRSIPLDPLVPAGEREELMQWRRQRLRESGGDSTAALLAEAPGQPEPIVEKRVRGYIDAAIARATGDPYTGFHHLRHSFATWTFFRFLRPLLDDRMLQGVATFEDSELTVEAGRMWRSRLLLQQPGQEALWLIAQMLGHASVDVTRRSYLRLIEWLNLCLSWTGHEADPSALGRLLALSRSSRYEVHQRWGRSYGKRSTRAWPATANTRWNPRRRPPRPLEFHALAGTDVYGEMVRLSEAAARLPDDGSAVEPATLEAVADAWQVSQQRLANYCAAAQQVHGHYRTRRGQPRFATNVRLPRSRAECADLREWLTTLALRLECPGPGQRFAAGRALAVSSRSLSRERSSVRLMSTRAAYGHIERLGQYMGIASERLLALVPPVRDESDSAWRRRQRRLAHELGLPTVRVQRRSGAPPSPSESPAVEISVQAPCERGKADYHLRRGSEAYRALVHYALIWLTMLRCQSGTSTNGAARRAD